MRSFFLFLILSTSVYAEDADWDVTALFDSALAQVGQSSTDLRFDYDQMQANWGGDRWQLPLFELLHRRPLLLPRYGDRTMEQVLEGGADLSELMKLTSRLAGHPIRRGLIGDQLERFTNYPDTLPVPSITRSRNALPGAKYAPVKDRIDLLYRLVNDKSFWWREALRDIDSDKYRRRLIEHIANVTDDTARQHDDLIEELVTKVNWDYFYAGAQDLLEAVERLADSLEFFVYPDFPYELKTRRGLIAFGTAGDDVHGYVGAPLLIIDPGGNDTYEVSGANSDYPLQIIIDLAGDDIYRSDDSTKAGVAGGVCAMSIVIDKRGNDRYEVTHAGLGAGLFGVGALLDLDGNDVYTGQHLTQGAGAFGVGMLIDTIGTDSFLCWSQSQGYGFTRGIGLLADRSGDDAYVAIDSILFSPSPQTPEHNASLAQGVGFGKRADYLDGRSWAGGIGLLVDGAGDDRYSAGLFAQGCAYWYALGMLLDRSGSDVYSGVWYVQGSGAHFAVGYLDDGAGDDTYTATHNMAVGAGHDFTIGWLNERAGNDQYTVPNLSLGGGNANGIGVFIDYRGDDTYTTDGGTTLGKANGFDHGTRGWLRCWGVFIDAGGDDRYTEDYAGNNRRWRNPATATADTIAVGVGLDR